MLRSLAVGLLLAEGAVRRVKRSLYRRLFKRADRSLRFDPSDSFSYATISFGQNVYVGPGAHFSAIKGITVGNDVLFGPSVSLIGGDHSMKLRGVPMALITEKEETDDLPIVIEDDVWVGSRAVILKGVTVGRGAVVAAGAVVTRSVPAYAIVAGIPARVIKYRGTQDEISAHEASLRNLGAAAKR